MGTTFIVLTNFYPPARAALQYADALASAQGGQLVLLHANRASLYDPYVFAGEAWRRQELEQSADTEALLAQLAAQLRVPATVEVTTDLLPTVAADLAARYYPAVFVLGLPAASHNSPEQVSATTLDLLRAAQLPLLLVPEGTAPNPPQQLLVAADREAFELTEAAKVVTPLLRHMGTELTVAYVSEVEDNAGCTRALRAVQHSGLAPNRSLSLRGYLHKSAATGIMEAQQDVGADLVLLMARSRSYLSEVFHRSVTAQVMARTRVPMMVVPVTEPKPQAQHAKQPAANSGAMPEA
ncbi:universal stress protein [Hymenobacter latericus]|uniref:universal stress protein n=1 Tax=Hymenobacter sp. YIM 151858-1 TaxID=2987688 RepID=UPI0022277839|nr:universal stress protein [Hymenobacter sp. YIM 151858-1]UYZ59656.1 universal stress protein [Hymenobacter sp. YIM 151858-1]